MAKTFFTSDTHFGHARIIDYVNRPFHDVYHMDAELIERWNNTVRPEDTVYHLGDFALGTVANREHSGAWALNGTIHFIEGNHDSRARDIQSRTKRFASYKLMDEIEIEGQRIVLCHYALRTWHHEAKGVWHLYGHSHGQLPGYGKSLDVGVDCWNFRPLSFEELKALMEVREIGQAPRFANYQSATV